MNKNITNLRQLSKDERAKLRAELLKEIGKRGVVTVRDLADKFNLKYSQVYIPFHGSNEVKVFKGGKRDRFLALAETKHAEVKEKIANYEPTSAVRRGRPALAAA